jgi:hypothetical protein
MNKCPYCAELIQDEAIVCRYCNRELTTISQGHLVSGSSNPTLKGGTATKATNPYVIGLLMVGIGILACGIIALFTPSPKTPSPTKTSAVTNIITSGAVIEKIEQVSELTTTKYSIQLVAKSETVGEWYLLGTTNVKMLLIARGKVNAGLDLAALDPSAVRVSNDGQSVTVRLPQVKIFDRDHILSSNPSDTYVYDVQKGIASDTSGTETQLRGVANDQILEAACKDGIMDEATKNAKVVVEQLLKTFFTNVTVTSAPVPSVDACKAK